MRIRTCRAHDLESLEWNGEFSHDRQIILDTFSRTKRRAMLMLVAELAGVIVGQVWLDLTRNAEAAYIWALRVRAPWRGRGIASKLLHAAEATSCLSGFPHTDVDVEPANQLARALYDRRGYVRVGLDPLTQMIRLRKQLRLA